MASISFFIRKSKTTATIWFRFSYQRGTSFRKSIGEQIPLDAWDLKKQKVKDKVSTSHYCKKINERMDFIASEFENRTKGEDVSNGFLERIWQSLDDKKGIDFIEFIDKFLIECETSKNKTTKRPYAKSTLKKYGTANNILNEFVKDRYYVSYKNLDQDFHNDIVLYMEEKGLSGNTIGGYLKNIKVFAKEASNKFPVHPFILSPLFYLPSNRTMHIYCSVEELKKIKNWKADSEKLNNVRNWFVFGCWTGLRVSDWKRVNKIDTDIIEIRPEKTKHSSGKVVAIPIHPWIKEIIKKDGMPRPISEQRFNSYIKDVCEAVGLKELVHSSKVVNVNENKDEPAVMRKVVGYYPKYDLISSHTCRRSFATNNYLLGIDTLTIAQVTGHTTEANFLKYIKVTPKQHAERLIDMWKGLF